jgi:hypothetical protein
LGQATILGSTVALSGGGAVTITANQPGNDGFNPAPPVANSFHVAKATATVTLTNLTQTYTSAVHYVSVTTSPANLSVQVAYDRDGTTVSSPTDAGSYSVHASVNNNDNYQGSTSDTLVINKATATLSIDSSTLSQTYNGSPKSVTLTISPAGLTVSTTYDGTANAPSNAGSYAVVASLTDPNYQPSAANGTLTIAKGAQSITFNPLAGKTYGDADFAVSATSSSGLAPTFSVLPGGPATISGSTVHITGAGSVTIHASQAGDGNYNAAASVDQGFAVVNATQTITFGALANKTFGNASFTVSATGGGSGNSVTFSASGSCNAGGTNSSTITITGAGSCTITAAQAGNSNYNAATDVPQSFTVAKATATIAVNGFTGTYNGSAHGATGSATGVASENLNSLLTLGASYTNVPGGTANWTFAGNANYSSASGSATITLTKATPTVTWNNPADIVYGTALSSTQLNATSSFGGNVVTGTFAYTPGLGTILSTGNNQNLSTAFTPTDNINLNNATGGVLINVTSVGGGTNGYTYRRSITIDPTKVPNTDRSNFPLLISGTYSYLATVANGGTVQNSNGYDVIFTSDSGCVTKLDHEVETYKATTGAVNYWVRVPTVSHASNSIIYMCYGKAAITVSQENKTGVWDSSFKLISHLRDGSTLSANDSTTDANNGTITGATAATSQIAGGASLNGSSNYLDFAAVSSFDFERTDPWTFSAWVKRSNTSSLNTIFAKGANSANGYLGYQIVADNGIYNVNGIVVDLIHDTTTNAFIRVTAAAGLDTNWHHLLVTYDGSSVASGVKIYVDGVAKAGTAQYDGLTTTMKTTAPLRAGQSGTNGNPVCSFAGLLDELRVSNSVRNADWAATEYNNQNSPSTFYTVSAISTNGYSYRRSITIDHTKVPTSDRSNFPMLISGTYSYLATVANGGTVQNGNGYDVIFTSDSSCATKLDHEVETYKAATGAVNYWVRVPLLLHASDSMIYMCYGNASITSDQSNKTGVWDSNYKLVSHLPDGTTLTATDSTSNGNNGTNTGATAATTQIAGGANLNGSSNYLDFAAVSSFDFERTDPWTFSAWVKRSSTSSLNTIFAKGANSANGYLGYQIIGDNGIYNVNGIVVDLIHDTTTNAFIRVTAAAGLDTNWHHLLVTYDGSSVASGVKIYVDGVAKTGTAQYDGLTATMKTTAPLRAGQSGTNGNPVCSFAGLLDELRVSNSVRGADSATTEYNNQSSPGTFYLISSSPLASGPQIPNMTTSETYNASNAPAHTNGGNAGGPGILTRLIFDVASLVHVTGIEGPSLTFLNVISQYGWLEGIRPAPPAANDANHSAAGS